LSGKVTISLPLVCYVLPCRHMDDWGLSIAQSSLGLDPYLYSYPSAGSIKAILLSFSPISSPEEVQKVRSQFNYFLWVRGLVCLWYPLVLMFVSFRP